MEFIRKHVNALLLACLLITLAASWFFTNQRLTQAAATVSLPVEQVTAAPSGRLEEFRTRREETALSDIAALQALCDKADLAQSIREDAAERLQRIVDTRQAQLALEGVLTQSGVYPCLAVITEGSVTIVTDQPTLSEGESALVMTLAQAHAGVSPSGVRVITAKDMD